MKNRIVLLDLGGVVFQVNKVPNKKIDWKIINRLNDIYETGEKEMEESAFSNLLERYNELTNQSLLEDEFLKAFYSTLDISWELIAIIKEKSDIIIVSDNYRESINYCSKKYDFDKWSLKQIYSYEYSMVKSNPDFFKRLLKENPKYNPENIILIDDSISKIESAYKHNIRGVLYKNNVQVRKKLSEFFS